MMEWETVCLNSLDECIPIHAGTFREIAKFFFWVDMVITPANLVEYFYTRACTSPLDDCIGDIIKVGNSSISDIWQHINGYNKSYNAPSTKSVLDVMPLFFKPRIHGNYMEEPIIVPFCSFNGKPVMECNSFQPANISMDQGSY